VLDVGPGWATYSKLLKKAGQLWDCVEIHEPYVKRFKLNEHYENIHVSNILDFAWEKRYDAVIFGDVLEHLTKENAVAALLAAGMHSDYVIISLPLDGETNAPPGAGDVDWGNVHELHIARWTFDEFLAELAALNYTVVATDRHPEISVFIAKAVESEA